MELNVQQFMDRHHSFLGGTNPHSTKSTSTFSDKPRLIFIKVTPSLADNTHVIFKLKQPRLKLDEFLSSCNYRSHTFMKARFYPWQKTLTDCCFKQTCTHLLKTTNANTKTEDQHENSKDEIIVSTYN